jgi:hypothetical protein
MITDSMKQYDENINIATKPYRQFSYKSNLPLLIHQLLNTDNSVSNYYVNFSIVHNGMLILLEHI